MLVPALVVALLAAHCDGRAGGDRAGLRPAVPEGGGGEPAVAAPPVEHRFRLRGPRPSKNQLYHAVGDEIDAGRPYTGAILDEAGGFVLTGPPGAPFHVRSEQDPTPAERRMLWMVDVRGTLGAGWAGPTDEPTEVVAPPRATVALHAPAGTGGPDAVSFHHEASATSATAWRDPRHGYFLAIWDAAGGNAYRDIAPPRPWTIDDIAPGSYVVGTRTEGRQWTARRVTTGPDAPLAVDAWAAPEGGGRVTCEDPGALLLLDGELPIPAPRITTALQFRSSWKGVPPGRHAVRYADGREVEIDVRDGAATRLGR